MSRAFEANAAPGRWATRLDFLILFINCAAVVFFGWWLGLTFPKVSSPAATDTVRQTVIRERHFVCAPRTAPGCDDPYALWLQEETARALAWRKPGR